MEWLLLGLVLVFSGLAVMTLTRAPTLMLFFVATGAREFGHFFAVGALVIVVAADKQSAVGLVTAGLALVASGLLASTAIRAARALPGGLDWGRLFRLPGLRVPTSRRIVYPGPGGPLHLDFYPSRTGNPSPLLVVIHGGGWMAGETTELAAWNPWIAKRGWAVASVCYRLVPGAVWPAQRDDVLTGLAVLRDRATELGIDPNCVVLLGRSAGGQIAAAIAADNRRPWLRGCICLYSPFDLEFAYEHSREDDVLRSRWLLRSYLGGTPADQSGHYHEASAHLTVRPGAPPFLLLHGSIDDLVWITQSRRFADRLSALGVPHTFVELPWATHAFDCNLHGPSGQVMSAHLLAFLKTVETSPKDRVGCSVEDDSGSRQ